MDCEKSEQGHEEKHEDPDLIMKKMMASISIELMEDEEGEEDIIEGLKAVEIICGIRNEPLEGSIVIIEQVKEKTQQGGRKMRHSFGRITPIMRQKANKVKKGIQRTKISQGITMKSEMIAKKFICGGNKFAERKQLDEDDRKFLKKLSK